MKRNICSFLSVILISNIIVFSSCEDQLNKPAPGVASEQTMLTEQGVEALLVGAYSLLVGKEWFGGCIEADWVYGSMASDEAVKGTTLGDTPTYNDIENFDVTPINQAFAYRWLDCYNGVARTNDCLNIVYKMLDQKLISEELGRQIEAEAKFLRAWYHFKANLVFRNIPYVKTPVEMDGMEAGDVPNDSPGWAQMEEDLKFAVNTLKPEPRKGEVGRADRWAALAFLSKVYLYQNKMNDAKPLLQEIIDGGNFSLADNYYDNFHSSKNNNKESVFEIQVSVGAGVNNYTTFGRGILHQKGPAGFGWGLFQPTQNLFNTFQTTDAGLPVLDTEKRVNLENDMNIFSNQEFIPTQRNLDPRVDYTIARRSVDFLGWGIHPGHAWIRDQANGGPYMTKKFAAEPSEPTSNGNQRNARNVRSIRYGHVLLWRAEIAVEDGDLAYARSLVNQVRTRAKNSKYVMGRVYKYALDTQPTESEIDWTKPAANYFIERYPSDGSINDAFRNKEEARKAVRVEERLEFATEGSRFFDLRRWGILEKTMNDYVKEDTEFRTYYRGQNVVFQSPKDEYWPIPQSQLDIQPALKQDTNY